MRIYNDVQAKAGIEGKKMFIGLLKEKIEEIQEEIQRQKKEIESIKQKWLIKRRKKK